MRKLPIFLILLAMTATACGGKSDTSSPSLTTTATPRATESTPDDSAGSTTIADADATAQNLLDLAKDKVGNDAGPDGDFGILTAWHTAFPGIKIDGYGIDADGSNISVSLSFLSSKSKNEDFMPFAVKDTTGMCVGGMMLAKSGQKPDRFNKVAVAPGKPCRGSTVADQLGY